MNDILKWMTTEEQYKFLNQFLPLSAFASPERKEEVIGLIVNALPVYGDSDRGIEF